MNFLSLFVLIPILMMAGLAIARDMKQIRTVAVTFSTLQLGLAIYTLIKYFAERAAGNTQEMLFQASTMWYLKRISGRTTSSARRLWLLFRFRRSFTHLFFFTRCALN